MYDWLVGFDFLLCEVTDKENSQDDHDFFKV